jgi:hypothetical protein
MRTKLDDSKLFYGGEVVEELELKIKYLESSLA